MLLFLYQSTLCENTTFLESISAVCLETENAIHTRCLEILCNLTKLPSNNAILSQNSNAMNALVKGSSISNVKDDRIWSMRAIQNITADTSSKEIVSTSQIIELLSKAATRGEAEQEAAVASMLNLSTDPVAIIRLMSTKKIVATLLQLAHSSKFSEDITIMACDTLATMAFQLQSFAANGSQPSKHPVTLLPSLLSTGWLRWN